MGRNLQGALDAAHQGAWQSSERDQASAVVVVVSRGAHLGRARASFESSPHHDLAMGISVGERQTGGRASAECEACASRGPSVASTAMFENKKHRDDALPRGWLAARLSVPADKRDSLLTGPSVGVGWSTCIPCNGHVGVGLQCSAAK
jgi:hypothetical protein